jgi:hypothetical protein
MRHTLMRLGAATMLVVGLSGCSGLSSVFNNQDEVCATIGGFEPWLTQMLPLTNSTGTIGDAQAAVATGLTETATAREGFSDGQQELLDRMIRALEEYQATLSIRPPEQPLPDAAGGLDSYQLNVVSTYRTMADTIGCSLPAFYQLIPGS